MKLYRAVVLGAWTLCCNALPPTGGAKNEAEHATTRPADDASRDVADGRAGELQSAPPETLELRLATWNLSWLGAEPGRGVVARKAEDYTRLGGYAAELDADVVAVQEVDGAKAMERVFAPEEYAVFVSQSGGAQRTGFAVRRTLAAEQLPDLDALSKGGLRGGVDVKVEAAGHTLRFLSVHLKSSCFAASLDTPSNACRKLRAQVPQLESWIDARAEEGVLFAVLGDFNRRFFDPRSGKSEAMWRELDDGEPPGADLWSPTENQSSRCWNGKHPVFVDHLVFGTELSRHAVHGSFLELLYDGRDRARRKVLSDHCALRVDVALPVLKQRTGASSVSAADRHSSESGVEATPSKARVVKGNIRRGRKLYHSPECPSYGEVVIDESKGERWFGSEAEAESAGFSRAGNCPKR